jgi:hypothetical protein
VPKHVEQGATAGGDLAGSTYPNPVVASLQGVVISGTPSSAQVLTATSPTAAHWAAPTGGGAVTSLTTTGSGAATLSSGVLNVPTPPTATFNSLTTTGTSGAATLASGVLNIPQYSGGGGTYTAGAGLTLTGSAFSLTAPVSVANGGTGSTSQNFVDLSTAQTVGGAKTLSAQLNTVNIVPTTNTAYTLGSSSLYWSNLYATRLNVNSTAYIDGSTAGQIGVTGNILLPQVATNAMEINGSYNNTVPNARGLISDQTFTGTAGGAAGIENHPTHVPTGGATVAFAYGLVNIANGNPGSATTITNLYAAFNRIDTGTGAGAVTTAYTMYASSPSLGSLKPTTIYGGYISNQGSAGVTTAYGLFINNQANATTNYGIVTGSGINSFGDLTGFLTNAPTHTVTLASTATGIALYNTSDQTTNYERVVGAWSGNVFNIATANGGTGTVRSIAIGTASRRLTVNETASSATGLVVIGNNSGSATVQLQISGTSSASSSITTGLLINPTINQSSTAAYTALLVNPTETTTGSGSKLLADFQVGGTSKTSIDNTGKLSTLGFRLGTTTTASYVLTADASGNGTWQPAGGTSYITSLTTTGTSGASTVTSGVLNIPQYSGGGGGLAPTFAVTTATSNTSFGQVGFYGLYTANVSKTITSAETYFPYITSGSTIEIGMYLVSTNVLLGSGIATTTGTAGYVTVTMGTSFAVTAGTHYYYAILNRTNESTSQFANMSGTNNVIFSFTLTGKTTLDTTLPTSGRNSTNAIPYIMFY